MDSIIWQAISGIGVIIDDRYDDPANDIAHTIKQLKDENLPLLMYNALPSDALLANLKNIAFIILDWRLNDLTDEEKEESGITTPSVDTISNISFLKKIKDTKFLPVFIITNEDVAGIENLLKSNGLVEDNKPRFIFVKSKKELKEEDAVRKSMIDWVKSSAPIYILEMFESSFSDAKDSTFSMFYNSSQSWAKIFYDTAIKDGADPTQDITELIIKNIEARISPLALDEGIIKASKTITMSEDECINVFQGRVMIPAQYISKDIIDTGYLFYDRVNERYCINITPSCDNFRKEKNSRLLLYAEHEKKKKVSRERYNNYNKSMHNICYVFDNLHLKFIFDSLKIANKNEFNELDLVGKIIAPYITDLQLRLSSYLIRQGLPAIPLSLVTEDDRVDRTVKNVDIKEKFFRQIRKYKYKFLNLLGMK